MELEVTGHVGPRTAGFYADYEQDYTLKEYDVLEPETPEFHDEDDYDIVRPRLSRLDISSASPPSSPASTMSAVTSSVISSPIDGNSTLRDGVPHDPQFATRVPALRAPPRPTSVKINVEGAFIVNDEACNHKNGNGVTNLQHGDFIHFEHKDIRLPHHVDVVSHIAVDIGGSLAKVVYFSKESGSATGGGRLNFLNFETERIDALIEFIQQLKQQQARPNDLCIMATGGGAYKFYNRMKDVLHVDVVQEDEMECLIVGLDFFITEIPLEVFTFSEDEPMKFSEARADIYPYLLVNIGSGVSMIKVSGPRQFQRVGGTSLGGGTFWGILSLLTGARNFDEMLAMADRGDNAGVDMLVGDIYGKGYGKIGLKSSAIASTFGKVFKMKRNAERYAEDGEGLSGSLHEHNPEDDAAFKMEDMSRSLLYAISNNIGQIAYLQSEKHDLKHIYFGGSFIRGHSQTMNTLSYAIRFWSNGNKQAYFLRHEGYLGAVGAFLKRQPKDWGRRNSLENLSLARMKSKD